MSISITRFHELVSSGLLGEVEAALKAGADVNALGRCDMTALFFAIEVRDLAMMRLLMTHGADAELADAFNHTPLRHAVDHDFAEGVELLLKLGVDRGMRPKYPLKPRDLGADMAAIPIEMPEGLQGTTSNEEWKSLIVTAQEQVRRVGLNPQPSPVITGVQSVGVLKMLLEAGDDLDLAPKEVKRMLVGLANDGELRVSRKEYSANRLPRFGARNPERMDNPFWLDMIRAGCNAYTARSKYGKSLFEASGAVWCFDRLGSSLTPLDDGRFAQIGGEHEDYYDQDFHIYNDVVIHDGHGGASIFGYPREDFPPTDFHTATLVGDSIFIIGRLGYSEDHQDGQTPIYRLRLDSWKIDRVETRGDGPGYIHKHRARHDAARNVIQIEGGEILQGYPGGELELVPNLRRHELDLATATWREIDGSSPL